MRRNVGRHLLMVLGVLALMTTALPAFADDTTTPDPSAAATAPAADATPAASSTPTTSTASTTPTTTATCDQYAGLMAKMAGCIRETVDNAALTFYDQIYPYLEGAIDAAMTLAVIVYGIALAFGAVEKVGRDTYIIMMKLAVVVVMCNSSQWIASTATDIMDGAGAAVVSYTPASGTADNAGTDFSSSICLQNMVTQQQAANPDLPLISPWLGIDCLVDTVIGIHITPPTTPANDATWYNKNLEAAGNEGPSRSLLYLFFSCLQSSILGLIMAIVGFIFIYGLLMLIVRCFFVYIAGYIGVTLLAIVSPLIIPMILFKETKPYFDKWVGLFISFILQPVLMLVFLIFSITAIDMAVYSGTYSVYYAIAGTQSQTAPFNLNQYLTDNKIITDKSVTALNVKAYNPQATPKGTRDTGGTLNQLMFSNCTPDKIKADPELKTQCAFQYPIEVTKHSIDWAAMETARQPPVTKNSVPGQVQAQTVLSSIFFCLMVVFVLNGLLAVVPAIVGDLLGSLGQSPMIGGFGKIQQMAGGKGGGAGLGKLTSGIGDSLKKLGLGGGK